jgi:hypothetical protein
MGVSVGVGIGILLDRIDLSEADLQEGFSATSSWRANLRVGSVPVARRSSTAQIPDAAVTWAPKSAVVLFD